MKEKIVYVPPARVKAEAELRSQTRDLDPAPALTPERIAKNWMKARAEH
jgi:hypothetical protein